jgi:hypothetical protein
MLNWFLTIVLKVGVHYVIIKSKLCLDVELMRKWAETECGKQLFVPRIYFQSLGQFFLECNKIQEKEKSEFRLGGCC